MLTAELDGELRRADGSKNPLQSGFGRDMYWQKSFAREENRSDTPEASEVMVAWTLCHALPPTSQSDAAKTDGTTNRPPRLVTSANSAILIGLAFGV